MFKWCNDRQNCRYWSSSNPNWAIEDLTQYFEVWNGIVNDKVKGSYIFNNNLLGQRYLECLCIMFANENISSIPEDHFGFNKMARLHTSEERCANIKTKCLRFDGLGRGTKLNSLLDRLI